MSLLPSVERTLPRRIPHDRVKSAWRRGPGERVESDAQSGMAGDRVPVGTGKMGNGVASNPSERFQIVQACSFVEDPKTYTASVFEDSLDI